MHILCIFNPTYELFEEHISFGTLIAGETSQNQILFIYSQFVPAALTEIN